GGEQLDYGGPVDSVERAHINPDGSLGAWQIISHMSTRRQHHGAVATAGYMYVIGGYTGSGFGTDSVQRAAINGDGSLGVWEAVSSLPKPIAQPVTLTDGRYIYAVGGYDGSET